MNPSKLAVALAASLFLASAYAQDKGPSDPQIAGIVVTANQIDIDAGKLAKSHTKNKEVSKFAQLLIPSAKNAELKDLIVNVRPAFVAHLDHAKMVQSSLAKK